MLASASSLAFSAVRSREALLEDGALAGLFVTFLGALIRLVMAGPPVSNKRSKGCEKRMVPSAPNKTSSSLLGGKSAQGKIEKSSGSSRRRDHRQRLCDKLAVVDDDFVQWQLSGAQTKADAAADKKDGLPLRRRKGQLKPVSKQELDESIAALANLL